MCDFFDSSSKQQEYENQPLKWDLLPLELVDIIIDILVLSNVFVTNKKICKNYLKLCNRYFYKTLTKKIIDKMYSSLSGLRFLLPQPVCKYPFILIDVIQNINKKDFYKRPIIIGYDNLDRRFIAFIVINEKKLITIHFLIEKYNNGSHLLNDPIIVTSKHTPLPPYYISSNNPANTLSEFELLKIKDILDRKPGTYIDLKIFKYRNVFKTIQCQLL